MHETVTSAIVLFISLKNLHLIGACASERFVFRHEWDEGMELVRDQGTHLDFSSKTNVKNLLRGIEIISIHQPPDVQFW